MNSTSLQDFVNRVRETRRISFGDLRRLQRDILPSRLTTREDAELLLSLDRAVEKADPDWAGYLVSTVRNFVVWGIPPVGIVDHAKAEWLQSAGKGSRTVRAIAREVIEQASGVDDDLPAGFSRRQRVHVQPNIGEETATAQAGEPAAPAEAVQTGSTIR